LSLHPKHQQHMQTHLIFFVSLFLLAACNTTPADLSDTNSDNSKQEVAMLPEGAKVHVVYFHGKQRCPGVSSPSRRLLLQPSPKLLVTIRT
jgi:uncharacterized lipoprotein YajG